MSKINIIVPVYNVEKYLPEFMESVLAQTFTDYTMFVVNDCSTDCTKNVIATFKSKFGERLHYLENSQNMKQGATRNRGLEEAEYFDADYTAFLDSDDILASDFLESMYQKAIETKADIVVCGMERIDDETGKKICVEAINGPEKKVAILDAIDELAFINPAPYNKLYKSSCIKGVRFKTMLRSEDTCYLLEILPRIQTIVYTNKVGYYYRIRNNSLTGEFGKEVCKSMFQGFSEVAELYKKTKYHPFYEVLETQVFIRSLIGGVCRASFPNMRQMGENITDAYDYMNKIFPEWRRNRYLCFGKQRSKGKKQFALKMCAYMYRMHCFWIFVSVYYIMLKVFKRDVRM